MTTTTTATTTMTMNEATVTTMPKTYETVETLFRLSSEVEPSLENSNRRIAGEDVVMDRELSDLFLREAEALEKILADISYEISGGSYKLYGSSVHCCGSKFAILSTGERRALCYEAIEGIPASDCGLEGAWYPDEIAAHLRPLVEERAQAD